MLHDVNAYCGISLQMPAWTSLAGALFCNITKSGAWGGITMKFIGSMSDFPFSDAVIYNGNKVLETVLTGIPPGKSEPVPGGAAGEMKEIFRQLDKVLEAAGLGKKNLCSARIYLKALNRDVGLINEVWQDYLVDHPLSRRCYGVDLQLGMLVEAAFVAEFPE
jgi:enamine deaminase RidA (YjgF/YER057c/UK114 family)